jgi:hypothetical protein
MAVATVPAEGRLSHQIGKPLVRNEERTMLSYLRNLMIVIAALLVAGSATSSYAETGSVRIQFTKAGFIVGLSGGTGTLVFRGRSYPLRIGGVSVGTFGATQADLVGRARNLRAASDIVGTYSAVGAGIAIAGGRKTARLQNSKGVVLELRGRQVGLELSIDLSGMTVALQ